MAYSKSRQFKIALGIVGVSIVLFVGMVGLNHAPAEGTSTEKTWRVTTIKAKQGDFSPELILHGVTESPQNTVLEAAINADIIKTPVLEGQTVKKGDVLVELDPSEAALALRQRHADEQDLQAQLQTELTRNGADKKALADEQRLLVITQSQVKRQESLAKKRFGSESALDEAKRTLYQQSLALTNRQQSIDDHKNRIAAIKAKLARAQALVARAVLDVKRTKIRAPFDGRVTKLTATIGNRVQAGEALISLYNTSAIEVRAQIPSNYVGRVHQALANQQSLVATSQVDTQPITLTIDRVAGLVGAGRGGVDALFKLNTQIPLALGHSLEINLKLPPIKAAFKIPLSALYGKARIYTINDKRMQSLQVRRLGAIFEAGESWVIIASDTLKPNMLIITTQLPNARDGLLIETNHQQNNNEQ